MDMRENYTDAVELVAELVAAPGATAPNQSMALALRLEE